MEANKYILMTLLVTVQGAIVHGYLTYTLLLITNTIPPWFDYMTMC